MASEALSFGDQQPLVSATHLDKRDFHGAPLDRHMLMPNQHKRSKLQVATIPRLVEQDEVNSSLHGRLPLISKLSC